MRWSVHLVTVPVACHDSSLGDLRDAVTVALQRTRVEGTGDTVTADAGARTLRLIAAVTAGDPESAFESVSGDFAAACVTAGVCSHARWDAVLVLPEPTPGPSSGRPDA